MEQDVAVLNETKDSEKEQQAANDSKALDEVVSARQKIYIKEYGEIIFDMPRAGVALEGDRIVAQFKTEHLRKNDYFTDGQLKAIYNKPTVISIDGKDITVGNGEWTEKDEKELESLPDKIQQHWEDFVHLRELYQEIQQEILTLTNTKKNKVKLKTLDVKSLEAQKVALTQHGEILSLKARLLELQSTRVRLFSDSLEEQAFFEKVKLFAPSCIKREVGGKEDFLWHTMDEMLDDGFTATRILGLFNLFIRGLDVSFFGDALEEPTSS